MKEQRMYGLWDSPVSPKSLAAGLRLSEPCWDTDGRTLAWVEGRSDRGVIVVQDADGGPARDLTPGDMSVRAFVGYGGGDFTLSHGACYFVGQADQRIYRQELAGGLPRAVTPSFGACSTPRVSPDGRWLVYVHTYEDADCIAVADTGGRHWPSRLAEGRDFYMQPAWHPSGDRVTWVEWDHPHMPWDETVAKVAHLAFPEGLLPVTTTVETVAGGPNVAIFQPCFAPDGKSLLYVSDESGWGQVYRRDLATGAVHMITGGSGEYGAPAWNHGMQRIGATTTGATVAVRNDRGFERITVARDGSPAVDVPLDAGYAVFGGLTASPMDERLAMVATGGSRPPRVIVVDLATREPKAEVRRYSDAELIPPSALSTPEPVSWKSEGGEEAHGLYYPPASERFESAGVPPLIVSVHGGPTSQVKAGWDAPQQFFATRGYGVLFVNYRGSTGYGRPYMEKLRESWGIYDVEDCMSGARALAGRGRADPGRTVIMGGSAGGYTVLQSLVKVPGFYKAGICLFGVSNMFTLAADTHKFEARYLDSMLGPLPEAAPVYRERSPIFHANSIVDPMALFQGDIDRVVPREQMDSIAASLRARGVPHVYHVYEGEGHGWRKAETIDHFWNEVDRFLREYVIFA